MSSKENLSDSSEVNVPSECPGTSSNESGETMSNAKRCAKYRHNLSADRKRTIKERDRLRKRKLKVPDPTVPSCSGTKNAETCKRYRRNMTLEERELVKAKDCARKRKSLILKKTKGKGKVKLRVDSMKRKADNLKRIRNLRKNMTTDALAEVRRKDLASKKKKELSFNDPELYPFHSESITLEVSQTDRTYLASKVNRYKANLKQYGASDCSSLFAKMLRHIKWHICNICCTRVMGITGSCYCGDDSEYFKSNLRNIGDVPVELSCLSTVEQLLIAKVHPVVQVYRLRGGQLGYSGHVINFFQDVKKFAKVLPHSIEHISGIVKVCCQTKSFHKDFCIRKDVVLKALIWLKSHNPLYYDIEIDESVLSSFPDEFQFDVTQDVSKVSDKSSEFYEAADEEENLDISSSSIPENNMIAAEDKLKHNLKWPELSNDPIDEMGKSRYIAMAFPTLFPFGVGDISEVVNENITSRDYFQYLMSFYDGRFASHKIFPYFAWNSVMRWECLTKGTVYMRKHPELKKVNIEVLKELMKNKSNIGKDVMVYSSSIRSTKNFWFTRCSELQDMVHQIDLPTIFFTISAADFHWPRLYDLLKELNGCVDLSETDRHKLMFDNPKVCSDYFYQVAEIFINEIMLVYFNVKDHWYRYEWQLRGSPHVHGVLWFAGAVNVRQLQNCFDSCKQKVIDYFDKLVSCQNPNTNFVLTPDHPCRVRIEDVVDRDDDIAALVNTVQRHTVCSMKTCLKVDKRGVAKCKHHFPKELREKSDIILSQRKYYEFEASRNDDRLNKFNEFVLFNWRGNHDFTAVLSHGGFTHYIAKYASKPEDKSLIFHDIFLKIVNNSSYKVSVKSAVQKTLMSSLVQRNYSAQEVHHLLAGHKLYSSSRSFVTLNLSNTEWFHHISLNSFGTDNFQDNCNQFLNSYSNRPDSLSKVCLLDFVKLYNTKTYQRKRGRPSIVRVFPRLNLSVRSDAESDGAVSRQLCILFCPWKVFKDLPTTDEDWHLMKIQHKLEIESLPYYDNDVNGPVDVSDSSDEEDNSVSLTTQDDWMKMLVADNDNVCVSDLGSRDIDLAFPWKSYVTSNEEQIEYQSFVKDHRQSFSKIVPILPSDINFNSEQNEILAYADNLAETYRLKGNFSDLNRFLVCQANAGCGKTVTIQGIVHLVAEKCGDDSIIVVAPTAAAAVNAGGRTIHSALRVSVGRQRKNPDLNGESLHKFQQEFVNVHFIIVEEFSMVGCKLLNLINRRCMQMRNSSEYFGGCAVFLFGDIKQLPPVGDKPLCKVDLSQMSPEAMDGYNLFRCVEDVKVLKTCHRQSDEEFCAFLENLSHGKCTVEDKMYIRDRFKENITDETDLLRFKDAIHLFMKRKGVHDYNEFMIRSMNIPILNIPATNNSQIAAACSEDVACNLMQNLYVGIGVRVMLRANLWTDAGLVNGAMGYVTGILYNKGNDSDVPDYILVKFDNYKGPVLECGSVPIPRVLRSWDVMDYYCTRIQFPIDLCYGTTYHKSQGLTLPKCVIHIHEKEMMPGMYYVSFSRVRRKDDLLIDGKFEGSPLFDININLYNDRNAGEEWLLRKFSKQ